MKISERESNCFVPVRTIGHCFHDTEHWNVKVLIFLIATVKPDKPSH